MKIEIHYNYQAKQVVSCRLVRAYMCNTKSTKYRQAVTAFHEEIELVTGTQKYVIKYVIHNSP